jgi:hypothetical protein
VEIAVIRLLLFALILFLFIAGIVLAIYFAVSQFTQKGKFTEVQRNREAKLPEYREPRNNAERYHDFISNAFYGCLLVVFVGLMVMTPLFVMEKTKEFLANPTKRDRHTFQFLVLLFMVVCSISLGALSILLWWERSILITAIAIFIAAWVGCAS